MMLPSHQNRTPRKVERALHRASETLKGLIAQTTEEVEETESVLGTTPCERPESLRSADAVLDRIIEQQDHPTEPSAFGKMVTLLRTQAKLSMEQLAEKTDLDVDDVAEIENSPRNEADPMSVSVLSDFFKIPVDKMQKLAGLTTDSSLCDELGSLHLAAGAKPDFDKLSKQDRKIFMRWIKQFRK